MGHHSESQEPVFAFMADPATHGGHPVRRIDTHAACVFLAGDRALKIKRAVRFPFLDYSSLDKRRAACEAELAVNRPFAPTIYRRVVPITREPDGTLALGGKGAPVEWAVDMRRFDEAATLDRVAEAGRVDPALADALGRAVAAAHAAAPVVDAEAWIDALATFIAQNDAAFRAKPDLYPGDAVEALGAATRDTFTRVRPLLSERGRQGLVRRGHGDLHLGNIALIDGAPVLFDAIEFDPLIAAGDVLYDLAFLLMDLIERGLTAAANTVFNRYLTQTRRDEDLDALTALPLFLSVRAAIRSKVTAARLEHAKPEQHARITKAAGSYFDLACRLIAPPPPTLIAVGGLSGTGKTALARVLAADIGAAPGAVVLRSDVERKHLAGREETERLPASSYTPDFNVGVYAALVARARRTLAAGHGAIVDAVFAAEEERNAIAALARARGVPFHGLFLTADLDTRIKRLGGRIGDASDADDAVARRQEHYDLTDLAWTRVDASGTPDETLKRAKRVVS